MKICLVTGIFPPDIGGPATYVSMLANHFYSAGWQVELITYADSLNKNDLPFPVHRILRSQSGLKKYIQTRRLVKDAVSRADIVYVNGLFIPSASALAHTNIKKAAKVVGDQVWERARNNGLTMEDFDEFQTSKQTVKIRFLQHLRNKSLRRMDRIIVPSEFLQKTVEKWGQEGKIEVIFNGIEPDYGNEFRQLSRMDAKKRLGLEGWTLISIGRLCSWKGFDGVIRSLNRLEQDVNLVIVGDGPEHKNLIELARRENVSERVTFTSRVSHEKIPLYLRSADCFILNSGYEGFPHVLLEAMAMECPVIAANKGGIPELIKNGVNGILVEKDDLEAIVNAIGRIRKDSSFRSAIIENGLKDVKIFTWKTTVEKTASLLKNMV